MSAHERKVMMMVINNLDAQVRWFIDEHKRLSDLVRAAERNGAEACCPWCREALGHKDCPAFENDGRLLDVSSRQLDAMEAEAKHIAAALIRGES